jgi:hypothetical protein
VQRGKLEAIRGLVHISLEINYLMDTTLTRITVITVLTFVTGFDSETPMCVVQFSCRGVLMRISERMWKSSSKETPHFKGKVKFFFYRYG